MHPSNVETTRMFWVSVLLSQSKRRVESLNQIWGELKGLGTPNNFLSLFTGLISCNSIELILSIAFSSKTLIRRKYEMLPSLHFINCFINLSFFTHFVIFLFNIYSLSMLSLPSISTIKDIAFYSSSSLSSDDNENEIESDPSSPIVPPNNTNQIIKEPLLIAKRRHYVPKKDAKLIQKLTGSNRPQGRPYSSEMIVKFCLYPDLISLFTCLERIGNLNDINKSLQSSSTTSPSNDLNNIKIYNKILFNKTLKCPSYYTVKFEQSNDDDNNNIKKIDVYETIKSLFGLNLFTFVKIIRTSSHYKGGNHIIKLETINSSSSFNSNLNSNSNSNSNSNEIQCSTEFVKREVAYPRYKANMKIYIIPGIINENLYSDMRMLLYDLSLSSNTTNLNTNSINHINNKKIIKILNKDQFLDLLHLKYSYHPKKDLFDIGYNLNLNIIDYGINLNINDFNNQNINENLNENSKIRNYNEINDDYNPNDYQVKKFRRIN